jgi:capsular polysaccharide export protein
MRVDTLPPLLRLPPFPGIAPAGVSIDQGSAEGQPADPVTARAVAEAMARARVGGAFWGRQLASRPRLIVADAKEAVPSGDLSDTVVLAGGGTARSAARRGALVARPTEVDPWPLIEAAQMIQAPRGSEIASLALAAGKHVVDHGGAVFDGTAEVGQRLLARRYRNPFTGADIAAGDLIALLAEWRAQIDRNREIACATGMAFWKRREVARLLWDGRSGKLPFLRPDAAIDRARREGGWVAAWPARVPANFAERAEAAGVPIHWVEDGFLRSAGLGSDLLPPLSLTVDDLWPYFDPARPSRLERLLATADMDDGLRARAAALREAMVRGRIGKYRAGGTVEALDLPDARRIVLVIGQVEDDLSVLRGGGALTGNLDLIERARVEEPDAFVIYRPHPDVEAGHRKGAIADPVALRHVDLVARGGSLDDLLARADAVHVLTSLTGFEALMRGVRVVVHGAPFYAGWGLTDDRGAVPPRRERRLSLDELVAGALILYPRYLDPLHGLPCTPERFISELGGERGHGGWLVRLRRWQGRLRRLAG